MADSAYTLADFETRAQSTLQKAVIRTWRKRAPVMERLAWKQNNGLDMTMIRTKTQPTAAWVKIGEALGNMKGTTEPYKERVYKMGGKIDIPREYAQINTVVDERANQEYMAAEAMADGFNYAFIKGDPTGDEDSIVGLWYRLKNLISSAQTVSGGGYDISPDTAQSGWEFGILDKLDSLRDTLEGDDCDALLMDIVTKERLEAAFRKAGLLSHVKDQVGRRFMTLGDGGPLIIPMGYKGDQTTKIITHVEADDGNTLTGGDATTIYAVKFGEPYLSGFHLNDIRVEDKGELEDGVSVRTIIDWTPGIYHVHPRSIARLVGIVAA